MGNLKLKRGHNWGEIIRLGATVLTKLDLKNEQMNAKIEFLEKKWTGRATTTLCWPSCRIHERFITSDCRDCKIEEFVEKFSGKRFPGLLGKPKIFFLNVYRGHNPNASNVFAKLYMYEFQLKFYFHF